MEAYVSLCHTSSGCLMALRGFGIYTKKSLPQYFREKLIPFSRKTHRLESAYPHQLRQFNIVVCL